MEASHVETVGQERGRVRDQTVWMRHLTPFKDEKQPAFQGAEE